MLCKKSQNISFSIRQFITDVYCYEYYSHLLIKKFQLIHSQIKSAAFIWASRASIIFGTESNMTANKTIHLNVWQVHVSCSMRNIFQ